MFNYNVSLHELPSENKVFMIILLLLYNMCGGEGGGGAAINS